MIVTDVIFAIPIGILYTMVANKLADLLTDEEDYADKVQEKLIILIIAGVASLALAIMIFGKKQKLHNRMVRFGLYFGTVLLWFAGTVSNWNILSDDVKVMILSMLLISLVIYSYK
jgi:hypothetical protein